MGICDSSPNGGTGRSAERPRNIKKWDHDKSAWKNQRFDGGDGRGLQQLMDGVYDKYRNFQADRALEMSITDRSSSVGRSRTEKYYFSLQSVFNGKNEHVGRAFYDFNLPSDMQDRSDKYVQYGRKYKRVCFHTMLAGFKSHKLLVLENETDRQILQYTPGSTDKGEYQGYNYKLVQRGRDVHYNVKFKVISHPDRVTRQACPSPAPPIKRLESATRSPNSSSGETRSHPDKSTRGFGPPGPRHPPQRTGEDSHGSSGTSEPLGTDAPPMNPNGEGVKEFPDSSFL